MSNEETKQPVGGSAWVRGELALAVDCAIVGLVCVLLFLWHGFGAWSMGLGTSSESRSWSLPCCCISAPSQPTSSGVERCREEQAQGAESLAPPAGISRKCKLTMKPQMISRSWMCLLMTGRAYCMSSLVHCLILAYPFRRPASGHGWIRWSMSFM